MEGKRTYRIFEKDFKVNAVQDNFIYDLDRFEYLQEKKVVNKLIMKMHNIIIYKVDRCNLVICLFFGCK